MNLFQVADQDQSIYYLGQLFGQVGDILGTSGGGSMIMGALFQSLNTLALAVGGLLVLYTAVMGLLKSAHEGDFLGRQWNSFWVPVRTVLGIACLFPSSTGFSFLQVGIMWVIVQGIGAADKLWDTAINFANLTGSPYQVVTVPTTINYTQNFQYLFSALTCAAATYGQGPSSTTGQMVPYTDKNSSNAYYYYCSDPNNQSTDACSPFTLGQDLQNYFNSGSSGDIPSGCAVSGSNQMTCNIGGGSGNCGTILFTDPVQLCSAGQSPGTLACYAAKGHAIGLAQVITTLYGEASALVGYDHDYLAFTENANPKNPTLTLNVPNAPALEALKGGSSSSSSISGSTWGSLAPKTTQVQVKQAIVDELWYPYAQNPVISPQFGVGNEWPIPQWLSTVCEAQNPAITPCCVYGLTASNKTTGNTCLPIQSSNVFPDPSDDKANAQFLWTNALQPYITGGANNTSSSTDPNFINTAVTYYTGLINSSFLDFVNSQNAAPTNADWANAEHLGWIMAGSYYYAMTSMGGSKDSLASAMPVVTVTAIQSANSGSSNPLISYRNDADLASYLLGDIAGAGATQSNGLTASLQGAGGANMSSLGSGIASSVMSSFTNTLTGNKPGQAATNPVVQLHNLGETFLIIAQAIYLVLMLTAMLVLVVSSISPMIVGSGLTQNPAALPMTFLFGTLWNIATMAMGWLFTFGGVLSIYIPLIPYILFTFGAIGWFTATIEAMVAGPFIALGILSPGGESEMLGRAAPSVMILLNIFLRPTLMIMGMMASMLLAPQVVTLINAGFMAAMGSMTSNMSPGILELIFFISAYCLLIIGAINKCFSLIYLIPNRVLTWIGGSVISYGEEEGLAAVKSGMDSAIGNISSGATGSVAATRKYADNKKAPAKKDGPSIK